jgi:hypothetical protein
MGMTIRSLSLVVAFIASLPVAALASGSNERIQGGKNATGSPSLSEMNQFAGTYKCVQTPQSSSGISYTVTSAMSANGKVFTETSAHFARRYAISTYDGTLDMIATQDNGDFDAYKLSEFSIGPFDITFSSAITYLQARPNSSTHEFTPTYEITPYNATIYTTKQKSSNGTTTDMQCTRV